MYNLQSNINSALEDLLMNSYDLKAVKNVLGYIKAELVIHHAKLSSYRLAAVLMNYADALKNGYFSTVRDYLADINYYHQGYMADRKYEPLVA